MPGSTAMRGMAPRLLVGHTLQHRYEVKELLGEGTLFATFGAQDKDANRLVIVKTLLPEHSDKADLISSLRTGISDVLTLNHVGIARPHDVGVDHDSGVSLFLVEDYVRGIDLRERIRRNAPLSHSVAVDVAIAITDALQFAVTRNVYHGDLRPTHVLTGPEGPIKLTAWGVAEAQSIAASENPALLIPSAPYTAPEVWATGAPSTSGDLYAVGVMLYEMLTGTLPFSDKGDALAIARRHATEDIPSPREFQNLIPRALDGVTRKLLAKKPAERYPGPVDLLGDLRTIRDALRFGRSLDWSPLDSAERPVVPTPESVRGEWSEDGTAVMPAGGKRAEVKPALIVPAIPVSVEPVHEPENSTIPIPVAPNKTHEAVVVLPVSMPEDPISDEEEEPLSAAMPAQSSKRKGHSFNWLLPLNLILATILVATCGYVVKLTFLALEPPTDVIVPNLVGKSLTEARSLGSERKFLVDVVNEVYNDKYPEDTIYQMRPEPGRHIRENKKVTVWVSKGPRMVTVPDVFDVSMEKARLVLEKAGLRVGDKKYEWDVITAKGNVMSQVPPANENRPRGTRVDLTLSKGPEPVEPDPIYSPLDTDQSPEAPDTEGVTPEADKESSLALSYDVPKDASSHVIRIDVRDNRGTRTLTTETHNAGETVELEVKGYGKSITFKVYDNDELQDQITGPPWSRSGDKKP